MGGLEGDGYIAGVEHQGGWDGGTGPWPRSIRGCRHGSSPCPSNLDKKKMTDDDGAFTKPSGTCRSLSVPGKPKSERSKVKPGLDYSVLLDILQRSRTVPAFTCSAGTDRIESS